MNWNNEMKNGTGYMNYHALQPKQIPKWAKAENLEMIRPLCELWGLSNTVDRTRKQISFKKIDLFKNVRYTMSEILYKMAASICPEQLEKTMR